MNKTTHTIKPNQYQAVDNILLTIKELELAVLTSNIDKKELKKIKKELLLLIAKLEF
jgi:hypothetical protein